VMICRLSCDWDGDVRLSCVLNHTKVTEEAELQLILVFDNMYS
jgi:hypothetical protein